MSGTAQVNSRNRTFRFLDILIILLCLSGAAASLNLFRLDLFRTINSQNEKPVGTIIIKNNTVQRRLEDRVLWDRLFVESPVYLGDLIRVADLSAASLHIESNSIDLGENTLIRITHAPGGDGGIQIELSRGNMYLDTGDGSIALNVMGRRFLAGPGTVLNAGAGEDGMVLAISEGPVTAIDESRPGEGGKEPLPAGTVIALDAGGREKTQSAAVVTRPRPNARYLKNGPLNPEIAFAWSRINIEAGEALRLELALDRNFTRSAMVIENHDDRAKAALGAGLWHWRLSYSGTVLSMGQITVTDAPAPELISPVKGRLFRYQTNPPQLSFQWSKTEDASHYILEASDTADFSNPGIKKQTDAVSFTGSSLGKGTWYWRVMPVFPPVYEGSAAFSQVETFRIEQGDELKEPVWQEPVLAAPVLPEPVLAAVPAVSRPAAPARRASPPPQNRQTAPVRRASPPPQNRPATPAPAVQPILGAPENRLPPTGYRIGINELRTQRRLNFTWSAVPEANAYIFTLYQQTGNGQRQILSTAPENRTEWTVDNIAVLDRGTFVWQVEAVSMGRDGTIVRHGRIEENSFILDIPVPGQPSVRLE